VMAEKRYLVALPMASLDREGRPLPADRVRAMTDRAQKEMTRLFGGATVLPAPGSSAASGGATERGQALVVSVCDDRESFLARRSDVHRLAEAVKEGLDQETALVLGFASDSFLVEDEA
jgi:hypothetical protein